MNKEEQQPNNMSPEEERKYWEERGPLAPGSRSKMVPVDDKRERCSSFLTIRMTGEELTQLRDIAKTQNIGPSTFVRQIVRNLLAALKPPESQPAANFNAALQQVFEKLLERSPELERKIATNYSTGSEKEKQTQFLIMDAAQTKSLEDLSYEVVSALVESVNPTMRVITPADSHYDAVKTALENPNK